MSLRVHNPFDGSLVAELQESDASAVESAITRAHESFATARRLTPQERSEILSRAAGMLGDRRAEFADAILCESGKPITLAEAEVDRGVITLSAAAVAARTADAELPLDLESFGAGKGHVGVVRRFPIGVIYGITPFNFPLNLVAHKVAPAVATGNTIIIKPSPKAPLGAIKLAELLLGAGAPVGQVQTIVCSNELAMRTIDDDRVKMVSFTGSVPVGWEIKRRAWKKRRVTLELGGNAALIVCDDADLDAAVVAAANGAFGYAGQSCISVQRIIVVRSVYDAFRERLVAHVRPEVRSGDPRDRRTLVGPMIDAAALARVRGLIADAVERGANVLVGNELVGPMCLAATLVENAPDDCELVKGEAFGPVATLHRADDFEHAIAIANDSRFGLQAGVFTRDAARARDAFERLDVGGVLINQSPTWRADTMPYGGVKDSGMGREGVRFAMEEMTEMKSMITRQS